MMPGLAHLLVGLKVVHGGDYVLPLKCAARDDPSPLFSGQPGGRWLRAAPVLLDPSATFLQQKRPEGGPFTRTRLEIGTFYKKDDRLHTS